MKTLLITLVFVSSISLSAFLFSFGYYSESQREKTTIDKFNIHISERFSKETLIGSKEKNAHLSDYYSDIRFKDYLKDVEFIEWCHNQGFINQSNVDNLIIAAIFSARQYTQADFNI